MAIVTAYRYGSGSSYADACFLGDRFDEDVGIGPEKSECWVLTVRRSAEPKPGHEYDLRFQRGNPGTYTGLWRSPNGAVWVSDADGLVHHNQDPWADDAGEQWTTHDGFSYMRANGVWGLDDDHVYVWLDHQGTPAVSCWTGLPNWRHLGDMNAGTGPGYGFVINAMHGTALDHLVVVGTGGRIARWNGTKWTQEECPVKEDLLAVFVVSADEAWATSAGGALLRFDGGWSVVTTHEKPLVAVAKWRDVVWTGGEGGLLRLDGDALRQVRAWQPNQIDARGDLLLTTATMLAGTADGEAFTGVGKGFLADLRAEVGLLEDFADMADDWTKVANALDDVSDLMFGYTIDHVNLEDMNDGDFASLVAECCTKLGIAEPADFGVVPRDPDAFIDHFLGLWDGETIA